MVRVEEISNSIIDFYWGGTTLAFGLKIAITLAIIGILLRGFFAKTFGKEAKQLFTSFKLNNSDYKAELGKCYDEGWERMRELRNKIKDARDPWKKHEELQILQADTHKCLTQMNKEGELLQKAYADMYTEYTNITKDIQELEKLLPQKKQEEQSDLFGNP